MGSERPKEGVLGGILSEKSGHFYVNKLGITFFQIFLATTIYGVTLTKDSLLDGVCNQTQVLLGAASGEVFGKFFETV
jgi:hypothetical protein